MMEVNIVAAAYCLACVRVCVFEEFRRRQRFVARVQTLKISAKRKKLKNTWSIVLTSMD